MTMTKKRRKAAGRPQGAKNHDRVDIVSIPPACQKCGSKLQVERIVKTMMAQIKHEGRIFTQITWKRTKCVKCDQRQSVRYLENPIL